MVIKPDNHIRKLLVDSIPQVIVNRQQKGENVSDQDVINYIYNDWPRQEELHLSEEYNAFFDLLPSFPKNLTPKIIHFAGRVKPWRNISLWQHIIYLCRICLYRRACLYPYIKYRLLNYGT
jgi:lipopolysaccharide biosynthesis glycosyltransferase